MTEVLLVLAISALVVPSLYIAVVSGFRQERAQETAQAAEAQLRRVTDRMTEDISEGAPSNKRSTSIESELSLEFLDETGELTRVFWALDGDGLRRQVLDGSSGREISNVLLLEEVEVDGPMFRYWAATGKEITDAADIAGCAVRVTVVLRTTLDGGDSATEFDVAHRVKNLEAEPC